MEPCPFWVEESVCNMMPGDDGPPPCHVCECNEDEIPLRWREEVTDMAERGLPGDFDGWTEADSDVWIDQDNYNENTVYIDLIANPERQTGYSGEGANRIWMTIYKENCFTIGEECLEERIFYRLISGMHGSITAHIAQDFFDGEGGFAPNLFFFNKGLGWFPDRMKNIYFTFLFVAEAVERAEAHLRTYGFDTGNPEEDARVQAQVNRVLDSPLFDRCPSPVDSTKMFQSGPIGLKEDLREKFRNVSRIMDCVGCEKCKIHAKLTVLGIGTALKILTSSTPEQTLANLQRNEVNALFNTMEKLADSIKIIQEFRIRASNEAWSAFVGKALTALAGVGVVAALVQARASGVTEVEVQSSKKRAQVLARARLIMNQT